MFNFFKRKRTYPEFEALKSFKESDCYFIRVAEWRWLDKKRIVVTDPTAPRILTFDPWPQEIFLAANGTKTIKEYIYYMADQYNKSIPPELDEVILNQLKKLVEYKIVKISDQQKAPETNFDKPRS